MKNSDVMRQVLDTYVKANGHFYEARKELQGLMADVSPAQLGNVAILLNDLASGFQREVLSRCEHKQVYNTFKAAEQCKDCGACRRADVEENAGMFGSDSYTWGPWHYL